jgi:hypothetical protein
MIVDVKKLLLGQRCEVNVGLVPVIVGEPVV